MTEDRFTISLKGLRFFADHGIYEEEKLVGNAFGVDIEMHCGAPGGDRIGIHQTINYAEAFEIVAKAFREREDILENCALKIATRLREHFTLLEEVEISIQKLQPPITAFNGVVGVRYRKRFA